MASFPQKNASVLAQKLYTESLVPTNLSTPTPATMVVTLLQQNNTVRVSWTGITSSNVTGSSSTVTLTTPAIPLVNSVYDFVSGVNNGAAVDFQVVFNGTTLVFTVLGGASFSGATTIGGGCLTAIIAQT